MLQEKADVGDYILSAIYMYECGINRLRWYKDTGEQRHLDDSNSYMDAANIYMREINKEEVI